ncbi:MAG TPA: PTS sugar transporter subunit IIC [Longimicrobium sp.]|nr:PTS sugar transporter subunit IIC [Longimicrobium sp.]
MILTAAQVVAVTLIGGLVALDATSLGQFMVSRPFVAAALGGLVVGRPAQGIIAGVVLEALHLAVLPVGAAKYPEGGPPALAAGAVYAANFPPVAASATLLVVVLVALALEMVGGRSVDLMRQVTVRFAGAPVEGLTPGQLARRHLAPMAIDFARGALLTLAAVLLLGWLLRAIDFSGFPEVAIETLLRLAVVAGLASALRLFGRAHYPLFLAGAAGGALVAWLR